MPVVYVLPCKTTISDANVKAERVFDNFLRMREHVLGLCPTRLTVSGTTTLSEDIGPPGNTVSSQFLQCRLHRNFSLDFLQLQWGPMHL